MHPPTPYPASGRSKSKMASDRGDKAFSEITGRMNVVSRSDQDLTTVVRDSKLEVKEKCTNKSNALLRRHSVSSRYAGSKSEKIHTMTGGTAALEIKPQPKRPSLPACQPPNGVPRRTSLIPGAGNKGTKTLFLENTITKTPAKKQFPTTQQAGRSLKSAADSLKKPASDERAPSTVQAFALNASVLKSASYWLEQVKLAEAIKKHAVAIGFFRLAVECEAEPVQMLREELISYKTRHKLCFESIYQVMSCYGVAAESHESLLLEVSAAAVSDLDDTAPVVCSDHEVAESQSLSTQVSESSCLRTSGKDSDEDSRKDFTSSLDEISQQGNGPDIPQRCAPLPVEIENESGNKVVLQEAPYITQIQLHDIHDELCNVYDSAQQDSEPACEGHIKAMDADSITREVVSYIMSSMDDSVSPPASKCTATSQLQDIDVPSDLPRNNDLVLNGEEFQNESQVFAKDKELASLPNFSDTSTIEAVPLDQAASTGSLPSLDVWNTLPMEVDPVLVQVIQNLPEHETANLDGKNDLQENLISRDNLVCQKLGKQIGGFADQDGFSSESNGSHSLPRQAESQSETASVHKLSDDGECAVAIVPKCRTISKRGQKTRDIKGNANDENALKSETRVALQLQGVRHSQTNKTLGAENLGDKKKAQVENLEKGDEIGSAELLTPKAGRLSSSTPRTSSKAKNASNPEEAGYGSRTRYRVRIDQSLAGRSIREIAFTQRQPDPTQHSPNATLQTPSRGSGSRSRRTRYEVSGEKCAVQRTPISDLNQPVVTPGSLGVRRSARLRPLSNVSTPRSP